MNVSDQLENLITEERNPRTNELDLLDTLGLVGQVQAEDFQVASSVQKVIPKIADAVDLIVEGLCQGGRLIYFGAGTSGRLGILDASECPPTFGVALSLVSGYIAGGKQAVFETIEGAEDHEEFGEKDALNADITKCDVVCGITASGRTPYVIGALRKAKEKGAHTISVTNNVPKENSKLAALSDVTIAVITGPEPIAGSTRMKAGSAQKMVLNLLTTCSMVKLGRVYENLMIDFTPTNYKLKRRACAMISLLCGIDKDTAEQVLAAANNNVKTAVLMNKKKIDLRRAQELLAKCNGFLRQALAD